MSWPRFEFPTNGPRRELAAAYKVHDFQDISVQEWRVCVRGTGHHLTIAFDSYGALGQPQMLHKATHRKTVGSFAGFTIDDKTHHALMATATFGGEQADCMYANPAA